MVGSKNLRRCGLVRVSMSGAASSDTSPVTRGRRGGIHYVADDHGLGREIGRVCLVHPHAIAKQTVA